MLMLTDTDPEFDLRVLDAWRAHGEPTLLVVDNGGSPLSWLASVLWAALSSLKLFAFEACALRNIAHAQGARLGHPLTGMRRFLRLQALALRFFWAHRHALRGAGTVYAHDQVCGTVAALAHSRYRVPYDYDAHEIVPFRPRRTGTLRVLLEFARERRIVRGARSCYVVNRPMLRIYRHLYGPANYVIRPNDFFAEREIALDPGGERLMVYVGATGAHRQLDAMARITRASRGEVLLCCDGAADLAAKLGATALCELAGYQEPLAARVEGNAPYVWCGFDPAVLSYRYSLPNKFFQAMAWGMPIVAQRGTYLARLVRRHGLGVVIDAAETGQAVPWEPETYRRAAEAMRRFRDALRRGQIVV